MFSQRSFWEFGSRGVNRCNGSVVPDVSENITACLHLQALSWTTHPISIRHSRPTAHAGATSYQKWPWNGCAYLLPRYIKLFDTGSISTQNKSCKNIHGDTNHETAPEYPRLCFKPFISCEAPQKYRYLAVAFSCALEMAAPTAQGRVTPSAGVACARGWQQTRILLHSDIKSTNKATSLPGNETQRTCAGRIFARSCIISV
jgi:hypothetical protein